MKPRRSPPREPAGLALPPGEALLGRNRYPRETSARSALVLLLTHDLLACGGKILPRSSPVPMSAACLAAFSRGSRSLVWKLRPQKPWPCAGLSCTGVARPHWPGLQAYTPFHPFFHVVPSRLPCFKKKKNESEIRQGHHSSLLIADRGPAWHTRAEIELARKSRCFDSKFQILLFSIYENKYFLHFLVWAEAL